MIKMISYKTSTHVNYSTNHQDINDFQVLLAYLESFDEKKRRIGYALSIPKFETLPPVIRKIIRQKWSHDRRSSVFDDSFKKVCDKTFFLR